MAQFNVCPPNVAFVQQDEASAVPRDLLLAFIVECLLRAAPLELRQTIRRNAMIDAALAEEPWRRLVAISACASLFSVGQVDHTGD